MAKKDTRRGDRHSPGYQDRFKRENYDLVQLRFRKDSGIMDALNMMNRLSGMPKTEYARDAIMEKLRKDGYLPE